MKVLFILPWNKIGEQALQPGITGMVRPAFACRRVGMETVILSDYVEGLCSFDRLGGIKVYRLPKLAPYPMGEFFRRSLLLYKYAEKVVRKEEIDAILCFFGTHHLTYLGVRKLADLEKPLVLLFDYCFYYRREVPENFSLYSKLPVGVFYKDRMEKWLMLRILGKADRVQVLSRTMKKYLERDMPAEKLVYIPYPVDTDFFSPSADGNGLRRELGLEEETLVTYQYGHDELLHHFLVHLAPEIKGEFRYFFPGPFRREPLLHLLEGLGLRDKTVITGPLPAKKVPKAIATSDICLSFEVGATIFTKTLEYASCGRPIVSLYSPGVAEVVRHGKEALISSSPEFRGNQEFLNYVEELVENRRLRERLGKSARKRILEGYSLEAVGEMYRELFESCLRR